MKLKILSGVLIGMAISTFSFAADALTGEKIKELFSNKTADIVKVDTNNENKKYLSAYTAGDGSRAVYIPWKDKTSERTWWIEGNKYCGSHPRKGDYCRVIKDAGNGEYHAYNDEEHVRTFKNFRDGNQL